MFKMLNSDPKVLERLDKLNGLLSVLVKLQLAKESEGLTQKELVLSLNNLGIDPKTIAELLNTTVGTVRVTISKNKK